MEKGWVMYVILIMVCFADVHQNLQGIRVPHMQGGGVLLLCT